MVHIIHIKVYAGYVRQSVVSRNILSVKVEMDIRGSGIGYCGHINPCGTNFTLEDYFVHCYATNVVGHVCSHVHPFTHDSIVCRGHNLNLYVSNIGDVYSKVDSGNHFIIAEHAVEGLSVVREVSFPVATGITGGQDEVVSTFVGDGSCRNIKSIQAIPRFVIIQSSGSPGDVVQVSGS